MSQNAFQDLLESAGKEVERFLDDFRCMARSIGARLQNASASPAGSRLSNPPMIDPVRFKRILRQLLKLLIVIELASAFAQGVSSHHWGRFGLDLLVAGMLFVMWERIATSLRTKKDEYRRKVEISSQNIGIWDSLVFSLLSSDEIYADIPADRKRLVVISYTLIAFGLVAAFMSIGSGLMPLVISGALVLGATNLLVWVVSLERGEKETLQTELKLARDVQMSLMPKAHPALAGFDIAGMSVPALDVGGDLFDYQQLGPEGRKLAISVFDVSGKGMQAAMSAVFTSGAFAGEARRSESPGEILTRLNKAVYTHSRKGHFVAFLLAVIDPSMKTMTFANAGQTKPLLRSNGAVAWLDGVGVHFPLGMQEDSCYQECTVQLHAGDRLFLLTDGFTDAMNLRKETFGLEQIERQVMTPEIASLSAEKTLEYLTGEVRRHAAGAPQHDDMTMVVVCAR
jgi:serine phosphatase RsbU (regulator of sigma subunit)